MGKAVKLNFTLLDIDLSAGYFHGYDYFPFVKSIKYIPTGNMTTQFDLIIENFFPKMDVYTVDFTTSIKGIGFWGEAGIYDYNKIEIEIITPLDVSKETMIDGKPYASYITGLDYNFENGFYFNLQYAYGLPYVRGKDFLEDYFLLSLQDSYFHGMLEINAGNMLGFNRARNAENNYELMLSQDVRYSALSDLIIGISFSEIIAKGNVLFQSWEKYDYMNIYISYSF